MMLQNRREEADEFDLPNDKFAKMEEQDCQFAI